MKFWVLLERGFNGTEIRSFSCASPEIAWKHAREAWGTHVLDVVSEQEIRDADRKETKPSNASACAGTSTKPGADKTG
jgi:hypothetical protein